MKIALAMIVKGSDAEADVLRRCLENVSTHVDGIFITVTQPNEAVETTAKQFGAVVSSFEWCNDFAAARNFNFAQVPKEYEYILWCDADDMFRGLEMMRPTIEANPADAYSMFYMYAFDEYKNPTVVHQKTQIVKNDGCVEWAGKLHEDFKENRELRVFHIDGIDRMHFTDETRLDIAKKRNLEVALADLEANPNDPRAYWNVGNSYKALGDNEHALEVFQRFLVNSKSDEEKYVVRLRMAESAWALGEKEAGMDHARYAVGLRPAYPDAYHLLGSLMYDSGRYKEAAHNFMTGLTKKPPYYSIIVFNPRDYDYVPLMNLAKTYFQMSRPDLALPCLEGCLQIYPDDARTKDLIKAMKKELEVFDKVIKVVAKVQKIKDKVKLWKALDALPDEVKSHPSICNLRNVNFIKTESSGKDIIFFCGFTEKEWSPEIAATKGVGGSEEAVIWLARLLARDGWNVTVYNNCGHKDQVVDGVTYKPFWSWNYRDRQDVVVLWRGPRVLDFDINADKIIIDLHDVIPEGEFTEARLKKISKIFVKSKFHRSLFPSIPDEKFVIVPNGIDRALFESESEKEPGLIVNTSSPDRSLSALIDVYQEIKKEMPGARCVWAYGWEIFDVVHNTDPEKMAWKANLQQRMKDVGIEELGRVSHGEVAKLYKKAQVFLYPSEFAEIDCISLSKACASGAVPVTTDFAAMGEKQNVGHFVHSEKTKDTWAPDYSYDFAVKSDKMKGELVEKTVHVLQNYAEYPVERMRKWALDTYDWESVLTIWKKEL